MDVDSEVNYKMVIEPQMFEIMNHIAGDCSQFMTKDDFIRALWVFVQQIMNAEYPAPPQWLLKELEGERRKAEADNTVEGEVGVDG
jgi:hypothetical protein